MTMLPDIDNESWDEYARQQLQKKIDDHIGGFNLNTAINDKISGLQSLISPPPEPAPPPPPPPEPEPQPAPPPPPPPPPEPEPAPPPAAAAPEPATPDYQAPGIEPTAPTPAPLAQPTPAAEPAPAPVAPTPAPTPGSSSDWFGSALNAVSGAGGDVQSFFDNFSKGTGDQVTKALNAAAGSGADVQSFFSSLPPPPAPTAPEITAGASPAGGTRPSDIEPLPDKVAWKLSSLIQKPRKFRFISDCVQHALVAQGREGWDPNSVQKGGGGRGLFQFDLAAWALRRQQRAGIAG
jgi:hypothetical protein